MLKMETWRNSTTTTTSGFWKELLVRIKKVDVTGLGSQLAFFFLLSCFPLLIFIMTLLPFLNFDQAQIFLFIREYAPESVAILIENTLGEVLENRNGGLLSIGSTCDSLVGFQRDECIDESVEPFLFHGRITFFLCSPRHVGCFYYHANRCIHRGTCITSFRTTDWRSCISHHLDWKMVSSSCGIIYVGSYLLFLIFLVFSLIYWIVPNLKIQFKSVFPGALFATVGWILTSLGFSFYVGSFANYSSTYGSIGAIIVLMMWLYFSAIILMLGGQLNAVMSERTQVDN